MKRSLLIIPFALVAFIMLSSTGFSDASGYDSTTGEITFTLHQGWNLVPMGISINANSAGNACGDYVKASYVYSPVQNQYLGAYYPRKYTTIQVPENSDQILQNEKNSNFYHATDMLGGMWLYTTRYCEFEANIQPKSAYTTVQENIGTITIKKGWNFITAAPFMINHNFKDLFQSCDMVAVNYWDDFHQKWSYPSSSQYAELITEMDVNMYEAGVGKVISVKVAEDCYLTVGGGGMSPPPLPD